MAFGPPPSGNWGDDRKRRPEGLKRTLSAESVIAALTPATAASAPPRSVKHERKHEQTHGARKHCRQVEPLSRDMGNTLQVIPAPRTVTVPTRPSTSPHSAMHRPVHRHFMTTVDMIRSAKREGGLVLTCKAAFTMSQVQKEIRVRALCVLDLVPRPSE